MTSLVDIVPHRRRDTVMVLGKPADIQALDMLEIARLLERFPDLMATLQSDDLVTKIKIIAPIIAAGMGHEGDPNEEAAAARLPLQEQVKLADAIMRLSMPESAGPLGNGSAIDGPHLTAQQNDSPVQ